MTGYSGWLRCVRQWWVMEKRQEACVWQGVQYIYRPAQSQTRTQYMDNSIIWLHCLTFTHNNVFMDSTKIRCQLCTCAQTLGIKDKLSDETGQERQYHSSMISFPAAPQWCQLWRKQDTEKGSITDRYPGSVYDGHVAHRDRSTSVHHVQ